MLLAVAIWILSAATRFGPVQRRQRELIPPRVLYVDAMAGLLDARGTSDRAQAVEPVRRELHDTLTRRLGARGDADAATLTELAERQWGANDERVTFAAALDRDVLDDEEIVRVGTALARLRRETMRGAR